MQIHSLHILTLFIGTKLFGDEITCVGVDELLKRKTPEMAIVTDKQLHEFALAFTKEINRFSSYRHSKKVVVEFPTARDQELWGQFFEFTEGKYIVLPDAMSALYSLYINIQRLYPLPLVRKAVETVK